MTGILQSLLGSVSSAAAVATDAFFNLVTLLLPGNGTNGAQNNTFLDSSSNNFTITRNGNTTQGTFSPFSQTGWSVFLDGSGDYLTGNGSLTTSTSQSSMSVEGWFYPTTFTNKIWLVGDMDATGATNVISVAVTTAGLLEFYWYDGNPRSANSTTALSLNQWNWFAVVVNSNAISMYVNSTTSGQTGTTTLTTRTQGANFAIGAWNNSATPNGYISNLRWSTSARTISSIPTAPYTSDANTRLLTCQSNRFVDNSSNGFTLTPIGNTSVQAFSPFAPTAAYSAATVGGSGYFDGTGDYLQTPSSSNLAFGTGDFCVEFWFYRTANVTCGLYSNSTGSAGGDTQFEIQNTSGNKIALIGWATTFMTSATSTVLNAWTHVAVVRSGTSMAIFFNGVRDATATSGNNFSSTNAFVVGLQATGAGPFAGYMAGLRSVKGSSVYNPAQTSITIPTAPPTAITNTQLLLNYTNAGITDATAKNDLETVGNAQISTTQSKFGGSSIYFDGTGDYLLSPSSQNFAFPGDFTIEFWSYITAVSGEGNTFYVNTTGGINIFLNISSNWGIARSGTAVDNNFGTPPAQNTWNHIAVSRSGSTINAYINGTRVFTGTNTSNYVAGPLQFGLSAFGSITGYIDDLRVTKFARYTGSTLTVPTAAFPLQ